uniref:Uncharacterized protein n=1 Tax=Schistosoma mansoni TaxID=6183 RepID=A0A5K4F7T3_SCHMA
MYYFIGGLFYQKGRSVIWFISSFFKDISFIMNSIFMFIYLHMINVYIDTNKINKSIFIQKKHKQ